MQKLNYCFFSNENLYKLQSIYKLMSPLNTVKLISNYYGWIECDPYHRLSLFFFASSNKFANTGYKQWKCFFIKKLLKRQLVLERNKGAI